MGNIVASRRRTPALIILSLCVSLSFSTALASGVGKIVYVHGLACYKGALPPNSTLTAEEELRDYPLQCWGEAMNYGKIIAAASPFGGCFGCTSLPRIAAMLIGTAAPAEEQPYLPVPVITEFDSGTDKNYATYVVKLYVYNKNIEYTKYSGDRVTTLLRRSHELPALLYVTEFVQRNLPKE